MPPRRRKRIVISLLFLLPVGSGAQAPPRSWSSAEIQKKIDRLSVVGSVLYIAAHPDDENTAFLATMANGYGVRTGYLAITRGEGGQNLIGSEQGALLGIVRSQELLQARAIDGAEQFFTRAIDFGYSKTMEETLAFWGKEGVLSDVVYIVRSFRPDVIVTRFTPDRGGHGNHTSSAVLALEAFTAAGDPNRFPEHLATVDVWRPKRIVWNAFRFGQSEPVDVGEQSVAIDLGAYDPVLGTSYTELAGRARTMHKSQGFGASESKGEYVNTFEHIAGAPASNSLFDEIDLSWNRIPDGGAVSRALDALRASYSFSNPAGVIPKLFKARDEMMKLRRYPDVARKVAEVEELIVACAGLWVDATTTDRSYVRGDSLRVRVSVVNRSTVPFAVESWRIGTLDPVTVSGGVLGYNESYAGSRSVLVPGTEAYSQPRWLQQTPSRYRYDAADMRDALIPENAPEFTVCVTLKSEYGKVDVTRPVRFRRVDPVDGEVFAPVRIVPRVTVAFENRVIVFPGPGRKDVGVRVRAHADVEQVTLRLGVPVGFRAEPAVISESDLREGEERTARVTLVRTSAAVGGEAVIEGLADGEEVRSSLLEANYPHIPPQTLLEPASASVVATDVRVVGSKIGYVMGAGDEIPEGLRQVGYNVTLLSDEELATGDLEAYDAILAGVRAYNTRPVLRAVEQKLRAFMEGGGVYVVQYLTTARNANTSIGPFPLSIGRDRVTDESAYMRLLVPEHPVFRGPNTISGSDFDGWVQERGLYFAGTWDDRYVPLLSSADPGESEVRGSLLYAPVGRGAFFYTGLSFFRQIPAGVPGAYRLLANLLSFRHPQQ